MDPERARELIAPAPDGGRTSDPADAHAHADVHARRLRMSELLLELGALEETHPDADARAEGLSVGELVDKAAEGGFGFLIGILALIAIPFFGLSTPFGLAIALLGAQLASGREHPWLPRRARARQLSMHMLDRVATMLARRTRWMVKATRRRYERLVSPQLIGLGVMLLALGLALPLPIPGSNLVFLVPIFIYAIGLQERDGLWIAIGHACLAIDLALLVVFGATVVTVLQRIWAWIS